MDRQARYQSIVETTPDVIVIMDGDGVIVEANPAVEALLGHSPENLIGRPLTDLMPERFRQRHTEGMRRYIASGKRNLDWRSIRLPALDARGNEIPVDISFGEFMEDGKRLFTGLMRDDRERVKAENLLEFLGRVGPALAARVQDYEQTLQTLAELAVPYISDWAAIDILESNGKRKRLVMASSDKCKKKQIERIEDLYPEESEDPGGVKTVLKTQDSILEEEIPEATLEAMAGDSEHLKMLKSLGFRSYAIVPLTYRDTTYGALSLAQAESNRRFRKSELPFLEDLGRRAALAVHNASAYKNAIEANARLQEQAAALEKQTREAQKMATDMSDQAMDLRRLATQLETKTKEAEAANKAKGDFLATMSHELRTPLNAIEGYTEILSMGIRGQMTTDQLSDLDKIKTSSRHLLGIINDVLNYSRISAGNLEYNLKPLDLPKVLADTDAMVIPQIEKGGIAFNRKGCAKASALADEERVKQVLLNLLSNAIRFTPRGGRIELRCEEAQGKVLLRVQDTGPGIPETMLEQIFEPFVQVNRTLNHPGQGTGLGLAISRNMARGMGGDLTVESVLGQGCTFTVSLPKAQDLGATPKPE